MSAMIAPKAFLADDRLERKEQIQHLRERVVL
jgi:hypothetical protein